MMKLMQINAINIETEQNRQRFKKMSQKLCCSEKPYMLGILPFFHGVYEGWFGYYIQSGTKPGY